MGTTRNQHYFLYEENKHLQKNKLDRWEFVVKTNKYVKYRQATINQNGKVCSKLEYTVLRT